MHGPNRGIAGQIRRVLAILLIGAWLAILALGWGLWRVLATGQVESLASAGAVLLLIITVAITGAELLRLERSVMRPLFRLNSTLSRYAAGDHTVRLKSELSDITELKQIQSNFNEFAEQIARTLSQLRRVDEERSELTATLTHELRTPLTSIRGYAQLLREGDAGAVSEEQKRYLDLVMQGADRLNRLVDQVLAMESREAELAWASDQPRELVDVAALLRECESVVLPLARGRAICFEYDLRASPKIYSDSFRLRQIFLNLISNAVKYNREGGRVRLVVENGPSHDWVLRVEDTGLGLTEREREALFKKFYRTEEAKSSGAQGSGLGLYITRKWVESLGGKIEVRSTKGQGSSFSLSFPLEQQSERGE
jgi:signal transduction histidine kinase